jgi:hypothetical protein
MKNKWLVILLVLTLIKGIAWMVLTPIFQAPDENVHFGMIQYLGENDRHPGPRAGETTSRELLAVAEVTNFNFVASHPVWQGLPIDWRGQIRSLGRDLKKEFVLGQEGQKLPQAYFWTGYPIYKIVAGQNFLVRFYALRILSVLLSLGTVYFTYLSARILLKRNLSLAVAFLVGMQPMYSVISSAVTYDSLAVLVATGFIYSSLKFIKTKILKWQGIALFLAIFGLVVKTQLVGLLLSWPFLLSKKQWRYWLVLPLSVILLLQFRQFRQLFDGLLVWLRTQPLAVMGNYFLQNYQALAAEVFPWYWGVFGWLEKTMPLWVYRILKIVVGLGVLGLVKFFYTFRKQTNKENQSVIFLLLAGIILASVVFINDFIIFTQRGSGFGVQGRYFIPAITGSMILLILGLSQLVKPKQEHILAGAVIGGSVLLNLVGLYSSYQYFGWVW